MAKSQPTPQTGALTLVLLVKLYRNQMIALLVKNGIVVNNNASDQQIAMLMANLLKISKSFFKDLNDFISNPTVAQNIAGRIEQTAQYSRMSGNGYMNAYGDEEEDYTEPDYFGLDDEDPVLASTTVTNTPPKKGFLSGLNLSELLTGGMSLFGNYTTAQSNAEIARQHALVEQAKADAIKAGSDIYVDPTTGEKVKVKDNAKDTGMSTTTIVVLSFVGVALLGTIVYFVAKQKK